MGLLLCKDCFQRIQYTPFAIEPGTSVQNTQVAVSQIYTTAQYRAPVNELIKTMKFGGVISVCNYLADLTYYSQKLPKIDIFCPVPLHNKRKHERGFDQAENITKHLSELYTIPWLPLLQRTRHLAAQSSISKKKERLARLQGSYQLKEKYLNLLEQISFQKNNRITIGLVDDVYTTGATLQACAAAIKAKSENCTIIGICMARD
jgi:ComF family protein